MTRVLILLLAAALAGCSIHSRVKLESSARSVEERGATSVSVGGDGVFVRSSALARLFVIGSVFAWAIESRREDERLGVAPFARTPAPDPARSVHAQDCTQPLENRSANLYCR